MPILKKKMSNIAILFTFIYFLVIIHQVNENLSLQKINIKLIRRKESAIEETRITACYSKKKRGDDRGSIAYRIYK